MIEIIVALVFLTVFFFLYERERTDKQRVDDSLERNDKILKTFDDVLGKVLSLEEKTQTKFYEMAARIETEHFKQLEKLSDKNAKVFDHNVDKLLTFVEKIKDEEERKKDEVISRFYTPEPNSIEEGPQEDSPLQDISPAQFTNIKGVQFDGEEEIYPISTS